jgi:hypothetical protein
MTDGDPAVVLKAWAFGVVRRSATGVEWLDYDCLSRHPEAALARARESDQRVPEWAARHPIVRVAPVVIEEREEPYHARLRGA